jgi:acyl carrier protein
MSEAEIRSRVCSIIDEIVGDIIDDKETLTPVEKLNIILSESLQALAFVTSLEDEFNIQFDDDQIDLELFQDVNAAVQKVKGKL